MESYSTRAILSVVDHGFTNKMKSAAQLLDEFEEGGKRASKSIKEIAAGAGVFKALDVALNGMKASLSDAVDRFDTLERFPKVMQLMGHSAEDSQESVGKLSEGIRGLPTSLDGIAASTQRIAVLTGNLEKATDTSLALNNAFLASGASSMDAERGLNQYVQMLSKGSVDLESWRTLQETMGYALSETAKQLGIASGNSLDLYEAIKDGEITFDAFNSSMIECSTRTGGFAEQAKSASAGIKTSFGNLGIAVTRGMANTIQAVDETVNKIDGTSIASKIDSAGEVIDNFFEGTAKGAEVAVRAVDTLAPSFVALAAGYVVFQSAMKAQDVWQKIKKGGQEARIAVDAFRNSEMLAAEAAKAQTLAAGALERVEKSGAVTKKALTRAEESATIAKISATAALKAGKEAEKAAAAEIKVRTAEEKLSVATLKLKKAEEKAAAAQTKNAAANEKAAAAVTKARADVDKKAAALQTAKAKAEEFGATAAELSARAETLDMAATRAKANADKDAAVASTAKTVAERAETMALELGAAAEVKAAAAEEASNIISAQGNALTIAKTALLGVLAGELTIVEALQYGWNAAMNANPIGTIITLITAMTAVAAGLIKAITKISNVENEELKKREEMIASTKEMNDALEEENKTRGEALAGIRNETKANEELLEKITKLSGKKKKSAEDVAKLQANISALNTSMEGLNLQYDEEADKLNISTDAIKERIEASGKQMEANQAQEKEYEAIVAESQKAQTEAVKNGTQQQITSLDQLSETQQEVVQSMGETWQSYAELATNMFDTLSDKSEISVSEMTENLQENQKIVGEWAENIDTLAKRGLDEGLLEQLRQAGPESAGYVKAMVNASDKELQALSESYRKGAETATTAFKTAFDTSDIPESVMGLVTKVEDSLNSSIASVDWTSLGTSMTTGTTSGIVENSGQVSEAAAKMATDSRKAAGAAVGEGSPATSFIELGNNMIAGTVIGVQNSSGTLNAAITSVMSSAGQKAGTVLQKSLSGMNVNVTSVFLKISAAAKLGMDRMSREVKSGSQKSNTELKKGTQEMQNSAKLGMKSIQNDVKQGMSQYEKAVTSGMNKAKSSVKKGTSSIVTETSRLRPQLYSSGYNASLGLAQGINAGAGAAISAANRIANRVAATMRNALKVHSPSRVTREIGGFTTEGFVAGLLDDVRKVKAASVKVAEAALPAGGIAARVARAGTVFERSGYQFEGTVTQNVTIVVPVSLDGREVARVTAPYTQEELKKIENRGDRKHGRR